MKMPWSDRESTIVPNSEKSRTLFMEAADSDKNSKSSEFTIGPSCIQFRLIIVKVEKFQSAVSGHPRGIPSRLIPHHEGSPRKLVLPFLLPRPVSAFVSTSSGLSHDPFASLRFPSTLSIPQKEISSFCFNNRRTIQERRHVLYTLFFSEQKKLFLYFSRLTKNIYDCFRYRAMHRRVVLQFYQCS